MVCEKVRVRFRKDGALRFVSHHDLMRCWERMLRRAALPFHSTAGFNPKPRLVFALSLGLGIVGHEEVVELEFDEAIDVSEIEARLADQCPAGMVILSVQAVDKKAVARVRRACYHFAVPSVRHHETSRHAVELLAGTECVVARAKPRPRQVDIRPFIADIQLRSEHLELSFWVTPNGTARPDEVLRLLGLGDLLDSGSVLERTKLELVDECDGPPEGHAGTQTVVMLAGAVASQPHRAEGVAAGTDPTAWPCPALSIEGNA